MVCLCAFTFAHLNPRQLAGQAASLSSWIDEGQALDCTDLIGAEHHHRLKKRCCKSAVQVSHEPIEILRRIGRYEDHWTLVPEYASGGRWTNREALLTPQRHGQARTSKLAAVLQ